MKMAPRVRQRYCFSDQSDWEETKGYQASVKTNPCDAVIRGLERTVEELKPKVLH